MVRKYRSRQAPFLDFVKKLAKCMICTILNLLYSYKKITRYMFWLACHILMSYNHSKLCDKSNGVKLRFKKAMV